VSSEEVSYTSIRDHEQQCRSACLFEAQLPLNGCSGIQCWLLLRCIPTSSNIAVHTIHTRLSAHRQNHASHTFFCLEVNCVSKSAQGWLQLSFSEPQIERGFRHGRGPCLNSIHVLSAIVSLDPHTTQSIMLRSYQSGSSRSRANVGIISTAPFSWLSCFR